MMDGADVSALPSGYGIYLFQTILALLAVCLLAYVLLRFGLQRLYGVGRGGERRLLRVVERLPLDPRRAVYLVEVAGRFVLLGTSDTGVSLLTEIEDDRIDEALGRSSPERGESEAEQTIEVGQSPAPE